MASGSTQQEAQAQAPQQQPYAPQMQPPYGQPYQPPSGPSDMGEMLKKRILIILILVGALILLIARVINLYSTDYDVDRAATLISTLAAFMIAASSVVWALGSKRTTEWQNLGLLILAALLFMAFG